MMVGTVFSLNRKDNSKIATPQNPKRPPLLPSEPDNNNGVRRPKSREVSSRYLSSASSTSTTSSSASSSSYSSNSTPRRLPSPMVPRTAMSTPVADMSRRSQSVERGRRIPTPRSMTPGNGGEISQAAKMLITSKRSLSVSFQGDSAAMPVSRTKLAPMANIGHARKGTPERRKAVTPVRDQRENSKPIDKQQSRWPARSMYDNMLSRSVDFSSERGKLCGSGNVVKALQKAVVDERCKVTADSKLKHLRLGDSVDLGNRSTEETTDPILSDASSISSGNSGVQECTKGGSRSIVVPARFWQETANCIRRLPEQPGSPAAKNSGLRSMGMVPPKLHGTKKLMIDSPTSSPRGVSASRGLSSPLRGAVRPASPSKYVASSTSSPVRGTSPSRIRSVVGSIQLTSNLSSTPSILSFAADARRGKVGENRIVDAHQLRLLYNQHLQWRFANARADAAMLVKKGIAEKSLYNAWLTTARLRHSVKSKRIELQLLRQNLKMHSILKAQMLYLENWDLSEKDYSSSLGGAIEALEAGTLRLPIVGGARADVHNLENAISSAVDVMQAMGSSICHLLMKVEHINSLASELANVTSDERASLDRCRDLLSTLTALQVKDCSLKTHVLQLKGVP